jgi:hypothetical protein
MKQFLKEVVKEAIQPKALNKIEELRDRVKRMTGGPRTEFHSGDIVKWKPGMKNRRFPEEDMPAIVMQVLPTPIYDTEKKDAGSPYFREPLDIIIGIAGNEGDIVKFHYDSRRFMLFDVEGKLAGEGSKSQ